MLIDDVAQGLHSGSAEPFAMAQSERCLAAEFVVSRMANPLRIRETERSAFDAL